MSFLENNKKLILVYKSMPALNLSEKVDLMLTPQFYTVKKEDIPVKYEFQAKKIAHSLFDGFLDDIEESEYFVYKQNNLWIYIAYNMQKISEFLNAKGIKTENVGKVFFSEQSEELFTSPVLVGSKDALVNIDGSVVIIPQVMLDDTKRNVKLDNTFRPKNGVSLKGDFASLLTRKQAIALATIFSIFAISFFIEGWRYSKDSQEIEIQISKLLEDNPSLSSQYTRKSILEKYKSIDMQERRKRDTIKTLGSMIFKGIKVKNFSMSSQKFNIEFSYSNEKAGRELLELAKKVGFSSAKRFSGKTIRIEEKL